jgi:hypothetical protein
VARIIEAEGIQKKDNLDNISVDDRMRLGLIARKSGVRMRSRYI